MVYFVPLPLGITLQSQSQVNEVCYSTKSLFSPSCLVLFIYIKYILFYLSVKRRKHNLKERILRCIPSSSLITHYAYRILYFFAPGPFLNLISNPTNKHVFDFFKHFTSCRKSFSRFFLNSKLQLAALILLLFLIIISNTSLLNPGPKIHGLTCFFQNIQGLTTFTSLGKSFPEINQTKITEFQSHIFEFSPDIIILNETWLKPTIKDEEILPPKLYKIFRLDRSLSSHPPDPLNPRKFKLNGGGVLIAVKNELNLNPKLNNLTCRAEALTVELSLPNKKKICVSTLYRVGTLGRDNFNRIKQYYNSIFASKKYKHAYIIGDFSLESVNWENNSSSDNTHSLFLDLFNNLGLAQLITCPTHRHGNILDILLYDSPDMIENLAILEPGCFVQSDHSPITFTVKAAIKRSKPVKGTVYNYKNADWKSLNYDLNRVDWEQLLNYTDIHNAWSIFKNKLTSITDLHIPKIKIKNACQSPWFDSEVFRLNKKKEHFRKLFKQTKTQYHYSKYSSLRKSLKA